MTIATEPALNDRGRPAATRRGMGAVEPGWWAWRPWIEAVGSMLLVALLLLASSPAAQAQCGTLPNTWPVTAGNGTLNANGINTVNGSWVSGSGGTSLTMAGVRTTAKPASFPSLVDVSSDPSTITLTNFFVAWAGSYNFAAGTYVINGGTISDFANITVDAGTRIFVKGTLNIGNYASFNAPGPTWIGQIYLYPNANITTGLSATIRGVIYGPGGGNNVNIGFGSTITGMIAVNSAISLFQDSISLGTSDQAAIGTISTCADTVAPTIASVGQTCGATTKATVTFSEPVRKTAAETTSNYTIAGITVTGAALSSDYLTVTLTLGSAISTAKSLTVRNVADFAGNVMTTAVASITPATLYPGLYGAYYDQNGNVGGAYGFTGTAASRVDSTVYFDWSLGSPGVGNTPADGFSVRWTGVIKINTTGSHGFATSSDDGVRLYVNNTLMIDDWNDHPAIVNVAGSRPTFTAGSYIPVQLDFYEAWGYASVGLGWQEPGIFGSTYYVIPAGNLFNCTAGTSTLASFSVVPSSTSGSTCSPSTVTITAKDAGGAAIVNYTGTVTLSTNTGRGTWALGTSPAPQGTLVPGPGDGTATYTFADADNGVVNLTLAHSLAQDVTASVTDGSKSASGTPIQYRDNAFVFAEDLSAKVAGSDIAVAGRPHDFTLSLVKKDPTTGTCGVATDYTGSRALKFWRTDTGGSFTAPTVVSPALTIPSAQPASNNLTLSFTSGIASFNLGSTDIGRYALNARDDALTYAATAITGTSNTLTVRPFTVLVDAIKSGATNNPNGSAATDTKFAAAGTNFSATVGGYLWNAAMLANGADPSNTGTPAAGATAAALKSGGLAPGFATAVTLSPVAASQTPAGGTLGNLSNGAILANQFSGGTATVATLQYSEVGSFLLNTTGVASNFLGSGLALDATVVNSLGSQNARIGRFVPYGFAVSGASVTHRSSAACTSASAFTYLGEPFQLGFTLTAQNAQGATTTNYTGSFAKLDLATAANLQLAGLDGSTMFSTATVPPRLTLGSSSGSWSNGVASAVRIAATAERATTIDGPFAAAFGIAPTDGDGVAMTAYDLDTTWPLNGNDRATVASVALRGGRLRLQNAIGAQSRALALPLLAQYWDGSAWSDNTLDNCTRIPASAVNFGNLRKTLTASDTAVTSGTLTLAAGRASLLLAAPASGHVGSVDVALSLGSTAIDASCLQPWTLALGDAATAGANLPYLRGGWCGATLTQDPSARASFGLYKGADNLLYQRENY